MSATYRDLWSLPAVRPPSNEEMSPSNMLNTVISDENVSKLITSSEEKEKAEEIFYEIAHEETSATAHRCVSFVVRRILGNIFENIFIRNASYNLDYPTLIMPTHRSYVDFLLLSYSCVVLGLGVPAIASGVDFLRLGPFLVRMMRMCGGFFIRRSFRNQKLYSAILYAYVQAHFTARSSGSLMFFIEGARNRSGKFEYAYGPRLGLLKCCVDCIMSRKVIDIRVIPAAVCYEKVPELKLFAREILGTSKPPESLSSLLKAISVIRKGELKLGNVYIDFGKPKFLSEYLPRKISVSRNIRPARMQEMEECEKAYMPKVGRAISEQIFSIVSRVGINREVIGLQVLVSSRKWVQEGELNQEVSQLAGVIGGILGTNANSFRLYDDLIERNSRGDVRVKDDGMAEAILAINPLREQIASRFSLESLVAILAGSKEKNTREKCIRLTLSNEFLMVGSCCRFPMPRLPEQFTISCFEPYLVAHYLLARQKTDVNCGRCQDCILSRCKSVKANATKVFADLGGSDGVEAGREVFRNALSGLQPSCNGLLNVHL